MTESVKKSALPVLFLPLSAITLLVLAFDVLFGMHFASQLVSRNYPQVVGQIISSKIEYDTSGSENANQPVASIRYSYSVNGHEFNGHRVRYVQNGAPESLVVAYNVGESVNVFYNPHNPQDAVLSVGVSDADWKHLTWQSVFNLLLIVCWSFLINKRARMKELTPTRSD